jgi:hypothetical protein
MVRFVIRANTYYPSLILHFLHFCLDDFNESTSYTTKCFELTFLTIATRSRI